MSRTMRTWLSSVWLGVIALLLVQTYAYTVPLSSCVPSQIMTNSSCSVFIQYCWEDWGIRMKWSGGMCQCDQFCGYRASKPCKRDPQCRWKTIRKRRGACYNKITNKVGTSMLPTCPFANTSSPTLSPTTMFPSAVPTRSPITSIPTAVPTTSKPTTVPTTSKPTRTPTKSPSFSKPTASPIARVKAAYVSGGGAFTCARTGSGAVKCWGRAVNGELGNRNYNSTSNFAVPVRGLSSGVTSICTGKYHACAVKTGGVKCWGLNDDGQLGDGTNTTRVEPVAVSGLSADVSSVACGFYHSCAVLTNLTLKCWGQNTYGQLGDGTNKSRNIPVSVGNLTDVNSVGAGSAHTCVGAFVGTQLWCWGDNYHGQFGSGDTSTTPTFVPKLIKTAVLFYRVSAGLSVTCTVDVTGIIVKCAGRNDYGQLGDGTTIERHSFVTPALGAGVIASLSTRGTKTCAVLATGAAKCWGSDSYGELGNGVFGAGSTTPVSVKGTADHSQISLGILHACTVHSTSDITCWGSGIFGQLGSGGASDAAVPQAVYGVD